MGLFVTVVFFALVEGALRLVLGPPAPPRLVRQLWAADQPAFTVQQGMVWATYQDQDIIPPFQVEPPQGVVRVMVFGESSVRGGSLIPLAQEFPALLEQQLNEQGKGVEILNLGRPAIDSFGLRILVEQALAFKPDVAVIYTGHNDIGNAYMTSRYGDVTSARIAKLRLAMDRLQLYAMLRRVVDRAQPQQFVPQAMTQHQTEAMPMVEREVAETDFKRNLSWIVRRLEGEGVRVVMSTVASLLMTWNAGLPACAEVLPPDAWGTDGMRRILFPERVSKQQAEAAIQQRPDCPEAYFIRGRWRDQEGDGAGALEDLLRARDLDRVPLRATSGILRAIKSVAQEEGVPLVDFQAKVYEDLGHYHLFADVVHLSAAGHALLAETIRPTLSAEVDAEKSSR